MAEIKKGQKAPDFEGRDQKGNTIKLDDYKGKKLVLYFYPKDNTPGCTTEAKNLKDNFETLKQKGFVVLGVSPDSVESHNKFSCKLELPFDLLADTDKKIAELYGVWGEKKMYGRTYMGIHRTTFVVDENGKIESIFKKVKTKEHTEQILKEYE